MIILKNMFTGVSLLIDKYNGIIYKAVEHLVNNDDLKELKILELQAQIDNLKQQNH